MTLPTGRSGSVRTSEIADPGPLTELLPDSSALLFVQDGDGLAAWGTYARIGVGRDNRFRTAEAALTELFDQLNISDPVGVPGTGPVAFGAFSFDPATAGSVLIVPQVIIGRRQGRAWRTVIGDDPAPAPSSAAPASSGSPASHAGTDVTDARVRYQGSTMSEVAWLAAVDQAVRELASGVVHKVVLARDRRVWSRQPFDARRLVAHLVARFPECQTFSIDGLVGASPEVLVARERRDVRSLVLAGTAARDEDPAGDEANAAKLLASDKDLREHEFAVDSVRQALEDRTQDLHVEGAPHILRLANVMHLATTVRGRLGDTASPDSALALAGQLHPSAAVCGTPTSEAQQMIRRLEGMDRARYSGPVGWVDRHGDGQWAIALRCAELDGTRARLFAGAGIVEGSLPEAELEETRLKLRAMQSAFEA